MVTFHTQMTNNMQMQKTNLSSICKTKSLILFPPIVIQKTNMHKHIITLYHLSLVFSLVSFTFNTFMVHLSCKINVHQVHRRDPLLLSPKKMKFQSHSKFLLNVRKMLFCKRFNVRLEYYFNHLIINLRKIYHELILK
jgi:hypothetical protein